jgi:hypothetical protein
MAGFYMLLLALVDASGEWINDSGLAVDIEIEQDYETE